MIARLINLFRRPKPKPMTPHQKAWATRRARRSAEIRAHIAAMRADIERMKANV